MGLLIKYAIRIRLYQLIISPSLSLIHCPTLVTHFYTLISKKYNYTQHALRNSLFIAHRGDHCFTCTADRCKRFNVQRALWNVKITNGIFLSAGR
jgi:hypothetical protein